ncbi:hypothetical protein VHEMI04411 [[Torrubiella] hemipterigena]|uniref:ABC transporter n=1 Tax=[Torrubiella] hemipterigena TaxID=1531966 RepID=A0A0A1T157_9HYPO|nr:hypothetical protein VHEMI04411 [[Torrubiella] hemipterigena]
MDYLHTTVRPLPWLLPPIDGFAQIHSLDLGPLLADYSYLQLALLLAPSAFVLLVSPFRILQLRRANLKVLPNYRGAIKAILAASIAVLELVILVVYLQSTVARDDTAIGIHVAVVVASLFVCVLSFFEHGRSVTPSTILILYLFASIACQSLQLQQNGLDNLEILYADLVLRFALLIMELSSKSAYLRHPYSELSPEQTTSSVSRAFLFWLNDLILLGNSKLLSRADLPRLDDGLRSSPLRERMEDMWFNAAKSTPTPEKDDGMMLLWVVFRFFQRSLLFNSVPRLMMIVFRYMQPVFINNTIRFVTEPATEINEQITGRYLILTAVVIYVGLGVSFCMYYQNHNRIKTQSRGALIGLIHARCLTATDGAYENASVVMHMSSDTDIMENFAWLCQEMWGQVIELMIGIGMLWMQLRWWCLMPLVIIASSSQIVKWTGRLTSESMVEWQKAKQDRIAITTSLVDYVKSIKMMGMTRSITDIVQASRINDLVTGLDYRWIVVYFNLTVNGISILTPVVTLVAYAVDAHLRGKESLDASTAFTSIAIITLVTIPANVILALVPQFATAYSCAARIQGYLLAPSKDDKRTLLGSPTSTEPTPAIVFTDVSLRPAATADICLKKVNISFKKGSLNVVCGLVGTGKTTLAKAILGEVTADSGTIAVSTKRMGYCAQKPWLINASVRTTVCGTEDEKSIDHEWYKTIIHACGLDEDLKQLSIGDSEAAGSRGVTLSGGQKQRVALARAVYARPEILVLDDVLCALDAKTEAHVAKMLLGPEGIFRQHGIAVVLITHATQYLPFADQIVVLGSGGIDEQGTWDKLRASTGYISRIQSTTPKNNANPEPTDVISFNAGRSAPVSGELLPSDDDNDELDPSKRAGDLSVYYYYFRCVNMAAVVIFFACIVTDGAALAITPSVLRAWSEAGGAHMWLYTTLYAASSLLSLAATGSVIWSALILIAPKAGEVLHFRVLKTIASAPLSYFSTTDSGSILNRFTEDMTYVDHTLPYHLMNSFWSFSRLISQLVLLSITQIYVAVGTPFLFFTLYLLQKLYLRTSRQIRYMDIELRAKVLSSFLETLEGVSHIRALGWQSQYVRQNIRDLDISQRPHYMMLSVQQWLSLVLDMLVAGLSVLIVGLAVVFRASTSGGQIGIALNIVLTISTTLTRLLQSWTQLETSLGAVFRIKLLEATLKPENKENECIEPPAQWPATGTIELQDVVASYNPKAIALNGISLTVHSGQKVGICGRTGSGKSTFLLALLRLVEMDSGTIRIDGIDLATLPRESIRERIVALPQDAFMLNDTIRRNIDPEGIASDEQIIAALEKVRLWDIIASRISKIASISTGSTAPSGGQSTTTTAEASDPLNAPLKELPLSHGQFQLFGVARALLLKTRSRILLLDEATSNVDLETDKTIQRIVREEFAQHTVITIAHKLDTIRDADTIVVMDKGRIVEIGSPNALLAKMDAQETMSGEQPMGKAWFREMWDSAHLE